MWRLLRWLTCQRCAYRASGCGRGFRILPLASVGCVQRVRFSCLFGNSGACGLSSTDPLEMPRWSPEMELAADACAHGDAVGVGGWVRFGSQSPLWFSERFRVQDFLDLGLPMDSSANLDIVSYETLAQIALVLVFSSACVGGRMRISIPSWTDNSGTEAVCSKLFTTVMPLALFAQRLATRCMAIRRHS